MTVYEFINRCLIKEAIRTEPEHQLVIRCVLREIRTNMDNERITALVNGAKAHDQDSIEKLLQLAHTSVSYHCRKMMPSEQDAEDLTQEILITVYTKLDTLEQPTAFWGWVNRITTTRCINALRRTHKDLQFAEDEDGNSVLDTLETMDNHQIPDKAIDEAETARIIDDIVSGLPEAQRLTTLMFYYDEMSVKEIAQIMSVSEGTVKSRLNAARKTIKSKVEDYEKQGVKLYSVSVLPFLWYFLKQAAQIENNKAVGAISVSRAMSAVVSASGSIPAKATSTSASVAGGSASASVSTATTIGSLAKSTGIVLSKKIIAGVITATVFTGTVFGASATLSKENMPSETTINTYLDSMAETTIIPESELTFPTTVPPMQEPITDPSKESPKAELSTNAQENIDYAMQFHREDFATNHPASMAVEYRDYILYANCYYDNGVFTGQIMVINRLTGEEYELIPATTSQMMVYDNLLIFIDEELLYLNVMNLESALYENNIIVYGVDTEIMRYNTHGGYESSAVAMYQKGAYAYYVKNNDVVQSVCRYDLTTQITFFDAGLPETIATKEMTYLDAYRIGTDCVFFDYANKYNFEGDVIGPRDHEDASVLNIYESNTYIVLRSCSEDGTIVNTIVNKCSGEMCVIGGVYESIAVVDGRVYATIQELVKNDSGYLDYKIVTHIIDIAI